MGARRQPASGCAGQTVAVALVGDEVAAQVVASERSAERVAAREDGRAHVTDMALANPG